MPPRYPVFWLTVLAFGIVAAATRDLLVGLVLIAIVLPAVLFTQWWILWLFGRFSSPVWLRRCVMLLPALVLAVGLFRNTNDFGGRQTAAVTIALAGHTPTSIRELHVQESGWTTHSVYAYFRCDPASLRRILEQHPFSRDESSSAFSFAQTPFPDLRTLPDAQDIFVYHRTDIEDGKGWCRVYTDSAFSFAYIKYGVD